MSVAERAGVDLHGIDIHLAEDWSMNLDVERVPGAGGQVVPEAVQKVFDTRFAVRDLLDTLQWMSDPDYPPEEAARLPEQLSDEIDFLKWTIGWES